MEEGLGGAWWEGEEGGEMSVGYRLLFAMD